MLSLIRLESWSSYLKWNLAQLVLTYKLFPACWIKIALPTCWKSEPERDSRKNIGLQQQSNESRWHSSCLPNTLLELLIAVLMEPGFPSIPEQTWDSWAKNRWKVNTCWGTCNKPHRKSRPQIWARSLNLPDDKWHNFLQALSHTCAWSSRDWLWKLQSLISDVQSEECWKETSDLIFRLEHHRDHAHCVVWCYKGHFCISYFHWNFCK